MVVTTGSQEETLCLGKRIGKWLLPGDIILLSGEMGAGKSVLARGIAAGLGISGPVPSPSFTILNVYETECCNLYHFDFYRISGVNELYESGLDEFIPATDGVAVIEWPENALQILPENSIWIRIKVEQGIRLIEVEEGNRIDALLTESFSKEGRGKKHSECFTA